MTTLNNIPIIAFKTAEIFETWLKEHHENGIGFWLKIFKKGAGIETINYAEALDVALCYGWIDGQKQKFDEHAWLLRVVLGQIRRRITQPWSDKAQVLRIRH